MMGKMHFFVELTLPPSYHPSWDKRIPWRLLREYQASLLTHQKAAGARCGSQAPRNKPKLYDQDGWAASLCWDCSLTVSAQGSMKGEGTSLARDQPSLQILVHQNRCYRCQASGNRANPLAPAAPVSQGVGVLGGISFTLAAGVCSAVRNPVQLEDVAILCHHVILLAGVAPEGDHFTLQREESQ